MRNFKTLPKMQFACSTDELSPSMMHVCLNKEDFVATDANILVCHKTKDFFEDWFINELPDNDIFIHRLDWAEMSKRHEAIFFDKEKNLIKVVRARRTLYFPFQTDTFKYPDWKSVVPKDKLVEIDFIGFNIDLFNKLSKALGFQYQSKLSFRGKTNAVLVSKDDHNSFGIIMPGIV